MVVNVSERIKEKILALLYALSALQARPCVSSCKAYCKFRFTLKKQLKIASTLTQHFEKDLGGQWGLQPGRMLELSQRAPLRQRFFVVQTGRQPPAV